MRGTVSITLPVFGSAARSGLVGEATKLPDYRLSGRMEMRRPGQRNSLTFRFWVPNGLSCVAAFAEPDDPSGIDTRRLRRAWGGDHCVTFSVFRVDLPDLATF